VESNSGFLRWAKAITADQREIQKLKALLRQKDLDIRDDAN
jgi:hypothetical protein